jgi:hypothetical protein
MGISSPKPQLAAAGRRNSDATALESPRDENTQTTLQQRETADLGLPQRRKSGEIKKSEDSRALSATPYRTTLEKKVSRIINLDRCDVTTALSKRNSNESSETLPASSVAAGPSTITMRAANQEDTHAETLAKLSDSENIDTSSEILHASPSVTTSDPVTIPVPTASKENTDTEELVLSPHSPGCSELVRHLLPGPDNKILRQVVREFLADE